MEKKISLNGLGALYVTFALAEGTPPAPGEPVVFESSHTVRAAKAEEKPVGVLRALHGGQALVQIAGSCRLGYTGSAPAPGWTALAADGSGGVKQAEGGRELLVTAVDTAAATAEVWM